MTRLRHLTPTIWASHLGFSLGRLHGVAGLSGLSVHTAAGVVIARELGVRVTDEAGDDVIWDPDSASNGLVIAWPRTHRALMRALSDGVESSK